MISAAYTLNGFPPAQPTNARALRHSTKVVPILADDLVLNANVGNDVFMGVGVAGVNPSIARTSDWLWVGLPQMETTISEVHQARVILGDSERQVAEKFGEAAKTYAKNPVALHLWAMNMLYEGLKENATIVIVPSTAVETMQLGGLAGMTALTMGLGQERASAVKTSELNSDTGVAASAP